MLALSIALTAGAVLLYVFTPALLIYSTHPWPVYAVLLVAVMAAWRAGGKGRVVLLTLIAFLGAAIFYVHSVRSRTEGGSLAIAVGDPFPNITLPTSTGATFTSADLKGHTAVLYLFYRGDWCPFCRTELSTLNEYYGRIRTAGVELFAVSVDPPAASEALRERLGVPFTFLSDSDGAVLDRLGIRHRGGHGGEDIAYPAQILVDRDGIVRWTFRADSYRQRAHPEDVLAAIEAMKGGD